MGFGLRVTGSAGAIQIDQDYRNLMRIASGSTGANVGNAAVFSLPYQNGFIPQIFVRPWADGQYVGGLTYADASLQQARIYTTGGFEWVAFGMVSPQQLDSSTYGLKVFASDGSVALDSRYELARIQSTILIGPQPDDGFGGTNYPQNYGLAGWGLRPWIGLNQFGTAFAGNDIGGTEYAFMMTTLDTATIQVRLAEVFSATFTLGGWIDNHFAGNNIAFPGRYADVPVLRRYTD
jgi:hypothetical protein